MKTTGTANAMKNDGFILMRKVARDGKLLLLYTRE